MRRSTERTGYAWWPYALGVGAIHLLGFLFLFLASREYPAFLGMGLLAYTLGLRHAFDADHIAAIDNTVRKLLQQGENPLGVGFFFSLGHSTVVLLMALATAFATQWAKQVLPTLEDLGGLIGTLVSGSFLLIIGIFNLLIWLDLWRSFQKFTRGEYRERVPEHFPSPQGLITRLAGPLWRFVARAWQVYPLGFLFGLGFDTASQVALMVLALSAGAQSLSWLGVLSLPFLFAAGMTLMDTLDGFFMSMAYGWAFSTPLRKLYYNLTVTAISAAVALGIGLLELLQIIGERLELRGGVWDRVAQLEMGGIGYLLVGFFALAWASSFAVWKLGRLEKKWG